MVPVAALAGFAPSRVASAAATPVPAAALSAAQVEEAAVTSSPDLAPILLSLWLLGVAASAAALTIRQVRFSRAVGRLSFAPGTERLAYAAHAGVGPMVIGVLSPKIVLPADFQTRYTPEEQAAVLAHEHAHLRAGDTRANLLIAVIRCAGWFNPFVHIAAACAHLDQELARDADVAARFPEARRPYAEALLKSQLAENDVAIACGWTSRSARLLKKRIAMLAKPSPSRPRRLAGATAAVCASVLAGLLAWAAQPARPAFAQPAEPTTNATGGLEPLAMVVPDYPDDADGESGSCTVTFDLTDDGGTTRVVATCSAQPFGAPAARAVAQWRYPPRSDGDAASSARTGLTVVLAFTPEAGASASRTLNAASTIPLADSQDAPADADSPEALTQVPPIYPAAAMSRAGDCEVTFDIAPDGIPTDVDAECTDPVFGASAIAAVARWRYAPLGADAASRESVMVPIQFRLAADD
jgi:TonB family protein